MTTLLGKKVQDLITGFEGRVTGVVYYISGCHQALVVPRVGADGRAVDPAWFDLQRLRVFDDEPIVLANEATPGCDAPAPVR